MLHCFKQILESTPTKQQLYGHLPPISQTIQVGQAKHSGYWWRNKDNLISNVLLWTPIRGHTSIG